MTEINLFEGKREITLTDAEIVELVRKSYPGMFKQHEDIKLTINFGFDDTYLTTVGPGGFSVEISNKGCDA